MKDKKFFFRIEYKGQREVMVTAKTMNEATLIAEKIPAIKNDEDVNLTSIEISPTDKIFSDRVDWYNKHGKQGYYKTE